jgi:hypothetical protein
VAETRRECQQGKQQGVHYDPNFFHPPRPPSISPQCHHSNGHFLGTFRLPTSILQTKSLLHLSLAHKFIRFAVCCDYGIRRRGHQTRSLGSGEVSICANSQPPVTVGGAEQQQPHHTTLLQETPLFFTVPFLPAVAAPAQNQKRTMRIVHLDLDPANANAPGTNHGLERAKRVFRLSHSVSAGVAGIVAPRS